MLNKKTKKILHEALKKNCPNNEIAIIVFANSRYRIILENWLICFRSVSSRPCIIVSMDNYLSKNLVGKIDRNQIVEVNAPNVSDRESWLEFMRVQISVLRACLDMGYDTLVSDIDAIWVKDALVDLNDIDDDLVFSPGSFQPPEALKAWGFVLCCGFFLSRARSSVIKFYDKVFERMETEGDQPSINKELLSRGINWGEVNRYTLFSKGEKKIFGLNNTLKGQSKDLSIAVLPNYQFQRIVENRDKAIVVHPGAPKNPFKKALTLAKLGLWKRMDIFYLFSWIKEKIKI